MLYFKDILNNILLFGISEEHPFFLKTRLVVANILSYIGFCLVFMFALIHWNNDRISSFANIFFFIIGLIAFTISRIKKNPFSILLLFMLLYYLFFLFIFYYVHKDYIVLWLFLSPPISLLFLGVKNGAIALGIFSFFLILPSINAFKYFINIGYFSSNFALRFYLTFILITLVFFLLEIRHERLEKELFEKKNELENIIATAKHLGSLLPICSNCKKIRNDDGYWQEVDQYISQHTDSEFTHGLCPDCAKKMYLEIEEKKAKII